MDVSNLSNATTAITSLSNLILVSPQKTIGYQPQKFPSFVKDTTKPDTAFLFNYEGEQSVSLVSDITDHYIENNEYINDQISLKPETIKTQGFIAELNDIAPPALEPLRVVADKLTVIGSYLPSLSVTALEAYNAASLAYSVAANAASSALQSLDTLTGSGGQTVINGTSVETQDNQNKQQKAFQKIYGYWKARTLFTVQTPWAVFQDMAIQDVHVVQDPETNKITTFDITFKIMRFAQTKEVYATGADVSQGRASSHAADTVDLGTQSLSPSSEAFAVA